MNYLDFENKNISPYHQLIRDTHGRRGHAIAWKFFSRCTLMFLQKKYKNMLEF
jgi:hypothetical protein